MKYGEKLNKFDGGLNVKQSVLHGELSEASDLRNVTFDDIGAVGTRPANTVLLSRANPIIGMSPYHPSDSTAESLMVMGITGQDLNGISNYSGVVGSLSQTDYFVSQYSGISHIDMVQYDDRLWMSDGSNAMKFVPNVGMQYWGTYPPLSAPTGTIALGLGNLSGQYGYVVAFENENGKISDYGPSVYIDTTNSMVDLTNLQSLGAEYGVSNRILYRTHADEPDVYYKVTSISNSVVLYTDNKEDDDLVTQADEDIGTPRPWSLYIAHRERIWAVDGTSFPNRLFFSGIADAENWPTDNWLNISLGDGYAIRALGVLADGLLIGKDDGHGNGKVYQLYMPDDTPGNWTLQRLDSDTGAMAPKMEKYLSRCTMLNRNGIFDYSESQAGIISNDPISYKIEPIVQQLNAEELGIVRSLNHNNRIYWSVPLGSDQTANNRIITFDYVRGRDQQTRDGAWSIYKDSTHWADAPISKLNEISTYRGDLIGASYLDASNSSTIWRMDQTSTAWDTNYAGASMRTIDSMWQSMVITGLPEHETNEKVWRWLYLTIECTGTAGQWMALDYAEDLATCTVRTELINLDAGGAVWGISRWGNVSWGPGWAILRIKVVLKPLVSRTIQLRFRTYTEYTKWRVYSAELFYNLRSMR